MNIYIKTKNSWGKLQTSHPTGMQWFWFFTLWCAGLLTATILAYPVKWIIRHL